MRSILRVRNLLPILGIASLTISCQSSDEETHERISGDVLVSVENSEGLVALEFETEEIYPCYNYYLDYELARGDHQFTVRLKKLVKPALCQRATGPARVRVDLGSLEHGHYDLTFKLNGSQSTAHLTIDSNTNFTFIQIKKVRPE